jgi:hypothetical protein
VDGARAFPGCGEALTPGGVRMERRPSIENREGIRDVSIRNGRHLLRCIITARCRGDNVMVNPWFSFGLESVRRGLEAQSAFVASLLRIVGGAPPEPTSQIGNTEQILTVSPLAEPPPSKRVSVAPEKGTKRPPLDDKIIGLKTRQAPKRAAAADSKRHAKTLRSRRKVDRSTIAPICNCAS